MKIIIIGIILVIHSFRVSAQSCVNCNTGCCCCNDFGVIKNTNELQKPVQSAPLIPVHQSEQLVLHQGYHLPDPKQSYPYAAYPSGTGVNYQTSLPKNHSPGTSPSQANRESENDFFGDLRHILFKKLDADSRQGPNNNPCITHTSPQSGYSFPGVVAGSSVNSRNENNQYSQQYYSPNSQQYYSPNSDDQMIPSRLYPVAVNQNFRPQLPTYTQTFSAPKQSLPYSNTCPDPVYKAPNFSPENSAYQVSAYPTSYIPYNSYSSFKNADSALDLATAYSAPAQSTAFYPASPPENARNMPDTVKSGASKQQPHELSIETMSITSVPVKKLAEPSATEDKLSFNLRQLPADNRIIRKIPKLKRDDMLVVDNPILKLKLRPSRKTNNTANSNSQQKNYSKLELFFTA